MKNNQKTRKQRVMKSSERTVNPGDKHTAKRSYPYALSNTNLYAEAQRRLTELKSIKQDKEAAIAKAPNGKIHIAKAENRVSFYLRNDPKDKSGVYISKSESSLIRTYIQKAYDIKVLKAVDREIASLDRLLRDSHRINQFDQKSDRISVRDDDQSRTPYPEIIIGQIRRLYSDQPADVKQYINPVDMSDEDYASEWLARSFVGKEIDDDLPLFETMHNERVRSKSELNIANALAMYQIPYKYECPLKLRNGKVFYPDFTVLDVRNRREIYWEHRGMMDNMEYANHSVSRLKEYLRNGIVIGKNLIITEETSSDPLGTNEIEMLIMRFFE